MKVFLLPEGGQFYKANLHCHTVLSDGRKTPEEIKELYQSLGYSIVAYTDHDIFIPHNELTDDTFLALNGFEVEISEPKDTSFAEKKSCHICMVALSEDIKSHPLWHRSKYLYHNAINYRHLAVFDESVPDYEREYTADCISDMMRIGAEHGFFVTYNHPTWSLENYKEYSCYHGMHAMEMFNGISMIEGYDDYNPRVYDDFLANGERIYCIGGDDNHNYYPKGNRRFSSGVAYTMIKAESLSYQTIAKALTDGHFYASEGPSIHSLWYEDGRVHIETSAADRIVLKSDIRSNAIAFAEESPLTSAEFTLHPACRYFRLTVIDEKGKHACTNAYFLDEITKHS